MDEMDRVCIELGGAGDKLKNIGAIILKELEKGLYDAGIYKPSERLHDVVESLRRLQAVLYATLSVLSRRYGLEKIKPGLNGSVEGARAFEKWYASWVNMDVNGKTVKLARALQIIGSGVSETSRRLSGLDPAEAARYITSVINLNRGLITAAHTLLDEYKKTGEVVELDYWQAKSKYNKLRQEYTRVNKEEDRIIDELYRVRRELENPNLPPEKRAELEAREKQLANELEVLGEYRDKLRTTIHSLKEKYWLK